MTSTETGVPNAAQAAVQNAINNAIMAKQMVDQIDEQLDLADNASETVRRNKVARDLVSEYSADSEDGTYENSTLGQFEKALNDAFVARYTTPELKVAAYTHAKAVLDKLFGEEVRSFQDEKIKTMPTQELTETERKALEDQRGQFAKLFKFSKEIVSAMGQKDLLPPELKEDLRIRRKGGTRGPSFVGTYRFYVETKEGSGEFEEKTVTIKGVTKPGGLSLIANTLGKEVDPEWQTSDLKDFILSELNLSDNVTGVTATSPGQVVLPPTWEVKLPAPVNRRIKGVKLAETTAPDDEDNDTPDNAATEADLSA